MKTFFKNKVIPPLICKHQLYFPSEPLLAFESYFYYWESFADTDIPIPYEFIRKRQVIYKHLRLTKNTLHNDCSENLYRKQDTCAGTDLLSPHLLTWLVWNLGQEP